eukprot:3742990-Amphidinium_carterae.2
MEPIACVSLQPSVSTLGPWRNSLACYLSQDVPPGNGITVQASCAANIMSHCVPHMIKQRIQVSQVVHIEEYSSMHLQRHL